MARELIGSERLRHAAIAIVLAVVVGVTTVLRPVDITVWSLQAKLFDHRPTSEFVFVEVDRNPNSPASMAENQRLLEAIRHLKDAGADQIFLDIPLQRSPSRSIDSELRDTLVRMGDKIVLTRAVRHDFAASRQVKRSDPFFEKDMRVVSNDYKADFLGYVWGIEASYSTGKAELPSLWSALAEEPNSHDAVFPDYSIDVHLIPRYGLDQLQLHAKHASTRFSDKTVILGPSEKYARMVKVPGRGVVPSTLIHLMGAETVARGTGWLVGWIPMLGLFGLGLILGLIVCHEKRGRRFLYIAWVASLILIAVITAKIGFRALFAETLAFAAVYATLRGVVNFKRRHLFFEHRSKLPNFVALQRDLSDGQMSRTSAIVVAKIARLDAIFATLSPADQGRYLRQLASRLALGDAGSTIYYDGGKFAFTVPCSERQDLQGHLEGLRAVASQSITVSQRVLDVSMTIGVDQSSEESVSSRLSSAIAAADQAREAYRPVFVISDFAADSEEWDYSLQARLESALSEDRISIKLQPQADLRSGEIVGAEALARWVDEEKGEISPARFILQCERVGRLDELTKRVLLKSLRAAETLRIHGHEPRISVNVSAIQFVDCRIADLIEMNLAAHSADPEKLTIEVTETARIESFSEARAVFEQVKRLGVSFSMDDFGVASANLEAMFELPFDEIKIDQMFVQRVHRSRTARAIVSNVTRLASEAGLTSVAEGVEDQETFALLREMGCDIGQGYYIARPTSVGEIQEMLTLQRDGTFLRNGVS